ncbi:MAG: zeta toxin family protein [Deltaproteobacteria bacterium]|nr:zeta toxin family protein [Deltaproteobacteria bacterium]
MKGDIVVINEHHILAARAIVNQIVDRIKVKPTRFVITVAGESGSGKSETGKAIANELEKLGINSVVLGQDDYFYLPPKSNSAKRHEDSDWLGPHIEVNFKVFEQNLLDAIHGFSEIKKPLVDYDANTIDSETISLDGVKVIIAEGTYTSLLKHVDARVFISRNWLRTLEDRKKRNRGNEVNDVFTEQILSTEHKIIAGHKQLADFIVNDEFEVINVEMEN